MIADLAALARALHVLRPDPGEDAGRMAAAFGLRLAQVAAPAVQASAPLHRASQPPPARPAPAAPERARPRPVPSDLEALDKALSRPPEWLGRTSLPPAEAGAAAGATAGRAAPLPSLLPARSARAIMLALAGESAPHGPPDLEALVRRIAGGNMVARIPRHALRRLAARIVVLLDEGPGMDPFAADQVHFVAALGRIVGRDRPIVRCFSGMLADGLRDPETGAIDTMADLPAGLVLMLSDFGAGQPSPRHSGHDAAALAGAGRIVIGLNPYPPERWPAFLPPGLVMLRWHEGLRLSDLRRARKRESAAP